MDLLYSTGNSTQYSVMTKWEKNKEKVDICITDSLCVHLKLTQHCKSTLPNKKKNKTSFLLLIYHLAV